MRKIAINKYIPLIFFIIISILLGISIVNQFINKTNNLSTTDLPSPFINKELPKIQAEDFYSEKKIFITDLFAQETRLINVWASWCHTCIKEYKMLMEIAKNDNIKLIGINYKDNKKDANEIIDLLGNPFDVILFDKTGSIGLDLGVYAIPESFLINDKGVIIYKYIGEITKDIWKKDFLPLI